MLTRWRNTTVTPIPAAFGIYTRPHQDRFSSSTCFKQECTDIQEQIAILEDYSLLVAKNKMLSIIVLSELPDISTDLGLLQEEYRLNDQRNLRQRKAQSIFHPVVSS